MHLDFFLPDYGVAIECQGGQHFRAIDLYGGDVALQATIERDFIKKQQCDEHGIRVLYYSYARTARRHEEVVVSEDKPASDRYKAGGADLGLSCSGCFEALASVYVIEERLDGEDWVLLII